MSNVLEMPQRFSDLAVAKIAKDLEGFSGGSKETAVSKFVASTLTHFCEDNERFAEVIYKTPRTLSDCCAEIMSGCGSHISDIDVYRGAVRSYFPNADINFKMEIVITGDDPSEEEIMRKPEKKAPVQKTKQKAQKNDKPAPAPVAKKESAKPAASAVSKPKPKKETLQLSLF